MALQNRESMEQMNEQLDTSQHANRVLKKQNELLQHQLDTHVKSADAIQDDQRATISKLLNHNLELGVQMVCQMYWKRLREEKRQRRREAGELDVSQDGDKNDDKRVRF